MAAGGVVEQACATAVPGLPLKRRSPASWRSPPAAKPLRPVLRVLRHSSRTKCCSRTVLAHAPLPHSPGRLCLPSPLPQTRPSSSPVHSTERPSHSWTARHPHSHHRHFAVSCADACSHDKSVSCVTASMRLSRVDLRRHRAPRRRPPRPSCHWRRPHPPRPSFHPKPPCSPRTSRPTPGTRSHPERTPPLGPACRPGGRTCLARGAALLITSQASRSPRIDF